MALNFPSNPTNGETYQSGSSATYVYNGTYWSIPSGQSGTSGTSGAQGSQGPQGTTGEVGPQGINGTAGSSGVQGPQGNQGPAGSGAQGAQGPTGGTGPQGNQGTQGPQGNQGTQGTTFNINQYSGSVFVTGSLTVSSAIIVSSSMVANTSSLYLTSGSNLYVQNNGLVEITGSLVVTGSVSIISTAALQIGTGSGDEGGEILLIKSQTNNSLTGSGITIDSYQNRVRIFEQGGNARGAYLNVASQSNSVGSTIVTSPNLASIQTLTSASYAALTPVSGTLYIIIG